MFSNGFSTSFQEGAVFNTYLVDGLEAACSKSSPQDAVRLRTMFGPTTGAESLPPESFRNVTCHSKEVVAEHGGLHIEVTLTGDREICKYKICKESAVCWFRILHNFYLPLRRA